MDEHKTALNLFFNKKRKLDRNRIKKKKQNINTENNYEYVVEPEKYLLQNNKGQEMISVIRKPKIVSHDQLLMYQQRIYDIQRHVLKMKYRLLFEYDSIENMNMILNEKIVPREKELELLKQKEKKMIAFHEKLKTQKTIQELKLSREVVLQQLKESSTIEEKKSYIGEYTELHKKIVDILKNTTTELIEITPDIDETNIKSSINNNDMNSSNSNSSENNNTNNSNNNSSSSENNNTNNSNSNNSSSSSSENNNNNNSSSSSSENNNTNNSNNNNSSSSENNNRKNKNENN